MKIADIDMLRKAAAQGRLHWHQHAFQRFLERGISRAEVMGAIMKGEVIERLSQIQLKVEGGSI